MALARVAPLIAAVLAGCAGQRAPLTVPPQAQERLGSVDWTRADTIHVPLAEFRIGPSPLVLTQGRPYRLHIENHGSINHNFDAPEFLQAAMLRPDGAAEAARATGGRIDVAAGQATDLYVVPLRSGTFSVECSRALHATLGKAGDIVVRAPS